jgi:hypothetical protein
MATNTQVSSRKTKTISFSDVAFDGNAEATVTVDDLRHIDGPEDVGVNGYSVDGASSDGAHAVCKSIGEDANGAVQLTLHLVADSGAAGAFVKLTGVTVNNLQVTATGL